MRALIGLPVLALLTFGVTGCFGGTSAPAIDVPTLSADDAQACDALLQALPETLRGVDQTPVDPVDAPARAWGHPSVVLTCGVPRPEIPPTDACQVANGVQWWLPDAEYADQSATAHLVAMNVRPRVSLVIPPQARPPADLLAAVAPAITATLTRTRGC